MVIIYMENGKRYRKELKMLMKEKWRTTIDLSLSLALAQNQDTAESYSISSELTHNDPEEVSSRTNHQ